MFTTRIFSSGTCLRSRETAAMVSSVGTSPAQAMTTSGSLPSGSFDAQSQIPIPASQCFTACSIVNHCGAGCFPATITLMRS